MHRKVLLSFAVLLGLTAVAQAVPSIVVGNYSFQQNTGIHRNSVFMPWVVRTTFSAA